MDKLFWKMHTCAKCWTKYIRNDRQKKETNKHVEQSGLVLSPPTLSPQPSVNINMYTPVDLTPISIVGGDQDSSEMMQKSWGSILVTRLRFYENT